MPTLRTPRAWRWPLLTALLLSLACSSGDETGPDDDGSGDDNPSEVCAQLGFGSHRSLFQAVNDSLSTVEEDDDDATLSRTVMLGTSHSTGSVGLRATSFSIAAGAGPDFAGEATAIITDSVVIVPEDEALSGQVVRFDATVVVTAESEVNGSDAEADWSMMIGPNSTGFSGSKSVALGPLGDPAGGTYSGEMEGILGKTGGAQVYLWLDVRALTNEQGADPDGTGTAHIELTTSAKLQNFRNGTGQLIDVRAVCSRSGENWLVAP